MDFIVATQFCCCKVDVFIRKIEVRDDMDVLKSLMILKSKIPEFLTQTYMIQDRWKIRSTTFQGIADAMADQWG